MLRWPPSIVGHGGDDELDEDDIQDELQKIKMEKRELELQRKLRKMQKARATGNSPTSGVH